MAKLDVKAAGLAVAVFWSVGIFLTGMFSMMFGWCTKCVELFSSIYIGYKATIPGSIIGAIWAFVDGGICGIVVAWLYNKFAK